MYQTNWLPSFPAVRFEHHFLHSVVKPTAALCHESFGSPVTAQFTDGLETQQEKKVQTGAAGHVAPRVKILRLARPEHISQAANVYKTGEDGMRGGEKKGRATCR